MKSIQQDRFSDHLDTVLVISKAARDKLGEDSFYCAKSKHSAVVSVYDGCGGLGARKYESFQGHTGAYMAARIVSGAVHDWYHCNHSKKWPDAKQLTESIDAYIRAAYDVCAPYALERMNIKGSMIRKLPTTMALAYAEYEKDSIIVHILWAGDSRVYLLNEEGLAQLTKDDTDVEDALENLMSDGAMTNVLSSDGDFKIHYKSMKVAGPTMVFAATDGCFGYIPSPMEYEYVILKSLLNSKNPNDFKSGLRTRLAQYAGDDLALGLMSFYYGNFENCKKAFGERLRFLEDQYFSILRQDNSIENIRRLWKEYKSQYERYLG